MIDVTAQASFALLAQAPAPEPETTRSLLDYIRAGGLLGYILIGLSISSLALVILQFIRLRADAWMPRDVQDALTRLVREQDLDGVRRYCDDPANASFLTAVIGRALARCGRSAFGFLELRSAIEEAGQIEADRRYRTNDGLQLLAALGPMLGLLGTVIGLIGAFGSLADLEGATRSRELARFMSLALVNTAQGLAVAIPCTAFYFYFKRRIDRLATDAGTVVERIVTPLEGRGAPDKPAPPRAAQPAPVQRPAPRPDAPRGVGAP
ncbi:MAG: MotA/TolQ/ExbB proton channel family protein [Planctomycetota bacterium]|nr:MotA/TolQ/ExbB proton channel family protein [Planctomycetota bacterium]